MNEVLSYFSVVIGDGQIAATGGVVSSNSMTRPVLIEPMSNETVAVGRDAILRCVVKHLQDYKVTSIHLRIVLQTSKKHYPFRWPLFILIVK